MNGVRLHYGNRGIHWTGQHGRRHVGEHTAGRLPDDRVRPARGGRAALAGRRSATGQHAGRSRRRQRRHLYVPARALRSGVGINRRGGRAGGHQAGERVHRPVVQPADADPGDRAQVPGQGLPRAGRAGKRRQDGCGVGQPGGDGGRRPGGVRPGEADPGRLRRQGFLRRRDRRGQRGQAGAQHDWPQRAAGHRRGINPGCEGRRGAGSAVGVRPAGFAGTDAGAARGAGAHDVPRRVRASQLRAEPGLQGHFAGDGVGPGV